MMTVKTKWLYIILATAGLSTPSHAQQAPPSPWTFSIGVQERSQKLDVWQATLKKFGTPQPLTWALFVPSGKGWEVTQSYLDQLTAADLMATTRSKQLGRTEPSPEDYDVMFASWCVFIPNKPPNPPLSDFSVQVVRALSGVYVNPDKRSVLPKAMRSVLLKGSKEEILKALGTVATLSEYNRIILDTTVLPSKP